MRIRHSQSELRPPKRGFTLLELLTVVGILAILLTVTAFGITRVIRRSHETATRTRLEVLKSLLAEYELQTRLTTPPPQWYLNDNVTRHFPPTAPEDFWHTFDAGTALTNPGNVADATNRDSVAIRNSAMAFDQFSTIPASKAAIGKLSADVIAVVPSSKMGNAILDKHILLDAWTNPIIFVPGTGLAGVNVGGASKTIQAPNNRPFFVSAGPDGDFSLGDDNLYSFEQ